LFLLSVTLAGLSACGRTAAPIAAATPSPATAPAPLPTASAEASSVPAATLGLDDAFLDRSPETIRVMTYNINWDSIFPAGDPQNHDLREFDRAAAFGRILRAVQADLVCLQEINYLRRSQDLGRFLGEAAAGQSGESWQIVHVRDNLIAGMDRLAEDGYRLLAGASPFDLQQAAALVDLAEGRFGSTDLYLVCAHFKSGGEETDIRLRSRQADVVAASLRDARSPGGELELAPGTPIVILGDFNIYATDPAVHVRTLQQGDITDEGTYGEDFDPDWDGTELADARPSHNARGVDFYTWRSESPVFPWGALDRIYYTDSVLALANAFILNTMQMSPESLRYWGMQAEDVVLDPASGYYDHLPLVADFRVLREP
jgi:endonuclease/exonuclease/phosphatase family metal-dependent hydrolase